MDKHGIPDIDDHSALAEPPIMSPRLERKWRAANAAHTEARLASLPPHLARQTREMFRNAKPSTRHLAENYAMRNWLARRKSANQAAGWCGGALVAGMVLHHTVSPDIGVLVLVIGIAISVLGE